MDWFENVFSRVGSKKTDEDTKKRKLDEDIVIEPDKHIKIDSKPKYTPDDDDDLVELFKQYILNSARHSRARGYEPVGTGITLTDIITKISEIIHKYEVIFSDKDKDIFRTTVLKVVSISNKSGNELYKLLYTLTQLGKDLGLFGSTPPDYELNYDDFYYLGFNTCIKDHDGITTIYQKDPNLTPYISYLFTVQQYSKPYLFKYLSSRITHTHTLQLETWYGRAFEKSKGGKSRKHNHRRRKSSKQTNHRRRKSRKSRK